MCVFEKNDARPHVHANAVHDQEFIDIYVVYLGIYGGVCIYVYTYIL